MRFTRAIFSTALLPALLVGMASAGEDCGNARDDDGDGQVDCQDDDCCEGANCAVAPCPKFRRGDVDADGAWTVLDAIHILLALTGEGMPLACEDSADFDDGGTVDLADPILLLRFVFGAGAPPPSPFRSCGGDPSLEGPVKLGCGFEFICR